jgi:hypothetical protein
MSEDLELFRTRMRGVLASRREQQNKPAFNPGELLGRLLGMKQAVPPGVRDLARKYTVENIDSPAAQAYLRGLEYDPESWPADVTRNKLVEQGALYKLNKMGSKGTFGQSLNEERLPAKIPRLPVTTAPAKKKNWWEWQY